MIRYTDFCFGVALSALLICFGNLAFTILDGHTRKPQNRIYMSLLMLLAVNAVCEMINVRVGEYDMSSEVAFMITRSSKYVYFLSHGLIAPVLYYYLSFVIGRSVGFRCSPDASKKEKLRVIVSWAIVIVSEFIVAINPLTHWSWYYTEERVFHRAWGEYIFIYITSGLWIIAAFIMCMKSWNILSKGRKRSIAICFLLAVVGVCLQLFIPQLRVEILIESIGFSGVLLFIENEDDRKNVELDVYNSAAFELDLKANLKNKIPVKILIIRNIRFDKTANTVVFGRMNRDLIIKEVSDYLGTVIQRYFIYSVGHGRFALTLYNYSDKEAHELAETIGKRFQEPWSVNGFDIIVSSRIMLVNVPERAKNVEEVIYIAECPIPELMEERIIEGKSLDWIIRRSAVEKAVTHGLDNGSFEVYYQPTYNIDRTLHGAEALLRMNDKDMGIIYPDEFIPIAEQLGIIDVIDEFVLKEVCKFLFTGIPQKNGMDCINVNLSVLECMKEGFAEYVSGVVEAEGIRKKMINFEITESVAAKDYDHLADVIEQLKHEGFQFSIDDYGTGYSNMSSLFSLGADIIKIDKSILWNAEKSELGMTLLKTSIDMVHKMQKKALMEGVETEQQIEILKKLGCEYLQGYYFSKPLPKNEFIRLIENN
ncbi:EAL domain-containing protein [Ruminococcus flavefaciens]|uniref:EAL domain, c-di-GMP-specific phosphodiesterase class I (Or its enzymatically inactive variant) n=1 Tax=Ruminococcus flavefaciens TaxID=1265 RepID=A0A1K1P8N2_RUMFL|nr:GGDEF domain-containing phosphodiesterase [Ruminococcus flavefaciens]SFW43805.1 EAL domain, c-di-GMP-specific phosphodiesterase class I (or its enzymatically inactive variant) [Ruminococcus flavefaciens]